MLINYIANSFCANCLNCDKEICLKCKENSILSGSKCICKKGYTYNKFDDACVIENSLPNDQITFQFNNDDNVQIDGNNSIDQIKKMFSDIFTGGEDKRDALSSKIGHFLLNGNITMNVYDGNDSPVIKKVNTYNDHSFNNETTIHTNNNAGNVILGQTTNLPPNTNNNISNKIIDDDLSEFQYKKPGGLPNKRVEIHNNKEIIGNGELVSKIINDKLKSNRNYYHDKNVINPNPSENLNIFDLSSNPCIPKVNCLKEKAITDTKLSNKKIYSLIHRDTQQNQSVSTIKSKVDFGLELMKNKRKNNLKDEFLANIKDRKKDNWPIDFKEEREV
jgi:hypothetical protein